MLNIDLKTISKTLSDKLKEVLTDLISSQKTAYVKNRHIGECGRLISDIIEITKIKKIEGFVVSMDIEKVYDSFDHNFLISTFGKYGSGQNLVKIVLKDQESCVSLMVVKLQSSFCLVEVPVKVTQFQHFYLF